MGTSNEVEFRVRFHHLMKQVEAVSFGGKRRKKAQGSYKTRQQFEAQGFKYPHRNISFQIVKGGTGKTSLSYSVAVRAFQYGARVLCVDLDQQANLTRSFNIEARDKYVWLNLFRDRIPAGKAVVEVEETLHVIPSNLNNSRLDVELSGAASNLRDLVTDKLAPIRENYDLVIMDCPPAINKINTAVTCASHQVIIPITPDPYAMDGLEFTVAEIERVRSDFKVNVDYSIIWNRFDGRERLGAYYLQELSQDPKLSKTVLPVVIRTDVSVKNAVFDSKSIFETSKKSSFREDVDELARELLGISSWQARRWGRDV